jgi:hypothetical protein
MAVNPLYIGIPIVGGVLLYLLLPKGGSSAYNPPPGSRAAGSGGPRAQSYQSQIQDALTTYRIAKGAGTIFGTPAGVSVAGQTLAGTLDVVSGMSATDAQRGVITAADKSAIDIQILSAKKEMAS